MSFYNKMEAEKEDWVVVQFRIPLNFFMKSLKGNVQQFHRRLSNGKSILMGRTNRDFWKEIKKGMYRYYYTRTHINFVYLLGLDPSRQRRLTREFQVRISKIFAVKVNVSPFELIDEVDEMLLNLPYGLNNYRKINTKYSH